MYTVYTVRNACTLNELRLHYGPSHSTAGTAQRLNERLDQRRVRVVKTERLSTVCLRDGALARGSRVRGRVGSYVPPRGPAGINHSLSWIETSTRQSSTLPKSTGRIVYYFFSCLLFSCIGSCLGTNICVALVDGLQLHRRRQVRRLATESYGSMPQFLAETRAVRQDETWRVDPQVEVLRDRRVDMGDISPANKDLLLSALNSGAQVRCVDIAVCAGAMDRQWTYSLVTVCG